MTFGEWIKAARKFHGLTLDEVAEKAGTSKSHVWEMENDRGNPTLATAHSITGAFGTELWRVLKKMENEE